MPPCVPVVIAVVRPYHERRMRSRRFILEALVGLAVAVPAWIAVSALQWDIIGVVFSLGGPGDALPLSRLAVVVLAAATCFVFLTLRGAALAAAAVAVAVVTRSVVVPGNIESLTVQVLAGSWMGIAAAWLMRMRVSTPSGWLAWGGIAAAGAVLAAGAWWLVAVVARAQTASLANGTSVALLSIALTAFAAAVLLAILRVRTLVPGALLVAAGLVAISLLIGRPGLIGLVSSVDDGSFPYTVWEVRLDQLMDVARSAAFDPALLALVGVSLALGLAAALRLPRSEPSGPVLGAQVSRA